MEKFLNRKHMSAKLLRKYIKERDKIQLRSKTAEELGIDLKDLTEYAMELGIPQRTIQDVLEQYTRNDFFVYIVKSDLQQSRAKTAMDLNIPMSVLRNLVENLGITHKIR